MIAFFSQVFCLMVFLSICCVSSWAQDCSEYYDELKAKQNESAQVFHVMCRFTVGEIEDYQSYFQMEFNYDIQSDSKAYINYEGYIAHIEDVMDEGQTAEGIKATFFGKRKTENIPYKGQKYSNHFKFDVEDYPGAYAYLIIEKSPIVTAESKPWESLGWSDYLNDKSCPYKVKRVSYSFSGVLDFSIDDHHGDYARLTCESTKRIILF